ncbi:MAG: hypothetical protein AB7G23_12530 [Vicinamibacterales bacterium]
MSLRRLVRGLTVICVASLSHLGVQPASASPVTLNLRYRVAEVCDQTGHGQFVNCTPGTETAVIHLAYDDSDVATDLLPDRTVLRLNGPLVSSLNLPSLPDPWGGPVARQVRLEAELEGTSAETHVQVLQSDIPGGCSAAGECDRVWLDVLELDRFFSLGPQPVPTPQDLERLLRVRGSSGSVGQFFSVAWYVPLGGGPPVYVDGSKVYRLAVPEPSAGLLLAVSLLLLGAWRGRAARP